MRTIKRRDVDRFGRRIVWQRCKVCGGTGAVSLVKSEANYGTGIFVPCPVCDGQGLILAPEEARQ